MPTRPRRKPVVPIINPAAVSPADLAENFRRVYAGALADGRSLWAGAGVYAAQVVPPLVVTDQGIALDWTDPHVYQVISDLIGDRIAHGPTGLVKVDEEDEPDLLETQLVDYTGDTEDWISVDIVKPGDCAPLEARVSKDDVVAVDPGLVRVDEDDESDFLRNQLVDYTGDTTDWIGVHVVQFGEHAPLEARVSKDDVAAVAAGLVRVDDGDTPDLLENQLVDYTGDTTDWIGVDIVKPDDHAPLQARVSKNAVVAAGGGGGSGGGIELRVHYKGADTVVETLSGDDWRKKLCRVWGRCGMTLERMLAMENFESGVSASLWPVSWADAEQPLVWSWGSVANNFIEPAHVSGDAGTVAVYVDRGDGGKLKMMISHPRPRNYLGEWQAGTTYQQGDVVTYEGTYYEDLIGGLSQDPPPAGRWAVYRMMEFWFYIRIDVMGTVPEDGYEGRGNAT
jgi:hypothetical protein